MVIFGTAPNTDHRASSTKVVLLINVLSKPILEDWIIENLFVFEKLISLNLNFFKVGFSIMDSTKLGFVKTWIFHMWMFENEFC